MAGVSLATASALAPQLIVPQSELVLMPHPNTAVVLNLQVATLWGLTSDVYNMIPNSSKATAIKQQRNDFMVGGSQEGDKGSQNWED